MSPQRYDGDLPNDIQQHQLVEAGKRLQFLEREIVIEAALERVRARAMTMRSSAELLEIAELLCLELKTLGVAISSSSLTAGIAHEIQNPLNFVNNFSEVNKELFDDLESEIEKGNKNEIAPILKDLHDNEDKVIQHCKRAQVIVKSMLQHLRTSRGEKELTDINALCDEYLRLSYHGLRAKDKSFNANFELHLDESLPKIEVFPQDIGRVLLNLINNAFQACAERSRSALSSEASVKEYNHYLPEVVVSTIMRPNEIEIKVSDNGPGIPNEIKDKIFQPFFTTKPTGVGTGLGLSLAYDIVKAHGGVILVDSTLEAGSEFTITLPIQK